MDTYSVLGFSLTFKIIAGILLGLLIGAIAYYQRRISMDAARTRQSMFSIGRDLKYLLAQLQTELDTLHAIARKEGSVESKAGEYQYWSEKVRASFRRIEQYPIKDIEKLI